MERMTSGITTATALTANVNIGPGKRKEVRDAAQADQRQQVRLAAPAISVRGVPGEYDHRKFLTAPFQGFVPVQTGAAGGPIVGTIAVTTNPLQWRDYDPGHFESPFSLPGEMDSKPYYWTNLATNPPTGPTYTPDPVAPTRPVVTERTSARVFSIGIVQERERHI